MTETINRPPALGRDVGVEVTATNIRSAGVGSQFRDGVGGGPHAYFKSGLDEWQRWSDDERLGTHSLTTDAVIERITTGGRVLPSYRWDLHVDFQLQQPVTQYIMDRLPVGSVIVFAGTHDWDAHLANSGDIWTKGADGWVRPGGGGYMISPHQIQEGQWFLRSIGAERRTGRLSEQDYLDAPSGTTITYRGNHNSGGEVVYRKNDSGGWERIINTGGPTGAPIRTASDFSGHWEFYDMAVDYPAVGEHPGTVERLNSLPLGSIICAADDYVSQPADQHSHWRKVERGWQNYRNDLLTGVDVIEPGNAQERDLARWWVHTIGPQPVPPDYPAVGTRPGTPERLDLLPVGSIICDAGNEALPVDSIHTWRKEATGWRNHSMGGGGTLLHFTDTGNMTNLAHWTVHTIGSTEPVVEDDPWGTVPPGCPAVGEYLSTREEVNGCPVGTVITYAPNANLTKSAIDRWVADGYDYVDRNITLRHHRVVSYPTTAPVDPNLPAVGEGLHSAEQFIALPVGSVISGGGVRYVKVSQHDVASRGWNYQRDGHTFGGSWTMRGYNTVISVGPAAPPEVPGTPASPTVIADAKREIREVIDECVREQGNWSYVRDGAFWMLGILPVPAEGAYINYGSAFGLPTGSVVRRGSQLWVVNNNNDKYPQSLHGDARRPDYLDQVSIVILGDFAEPAYRDRNHLIHTLWVRQRELQQRYDWCSAVENCLNNAGLSDPGDVPDVPVVPLTAPEVGVRTRFDRDRFALLPVGSVIVCHTVDTNYVRTTARPSGWAQLSNLTEALLNNTDCTVLSTV